MMRGVLSSFGSVFEISSDFFVANDTNAVYLLWGYIRDFANIALIIILLVMIFSQLTGVGIDNYGLKKILPRFVVSVLLINISFVICQVLVDVSNILGSSLSSLLGSIAERIKVTLVANGISSSWVELGFSGLLTGLFAASAGAAAVAGSVVSLIATIGTATIWVWLIPLIIAILIAFVAVILFFLLLAARQILVMVCAAISPLAFVCLIFPNTQSLFKKWTSLFKALLLLYPICGALHGLSAVIKVITYTASGTHIFMVMIAMISTFIPFFLAPSLLKKALGGIGMIGAKLQGAATKGLRTASSGLKNSEAGQEGIRRNQIQRAENRAKRFEQAQGAGENATRRQRRLVNSKWRQNQNARDLNFINKSRIEDAERGATSAMGLSGVMSIEDRAAQANYKREMAEVEARESNILVSDTADDFTALQTGLETAITNGDTIGIRAYQNVLSRKGEDGRQAVHNAMANAETTARNNGTTVSDAARRAYSSNLMNKWAGDYKNYSRSTFAYASKNTGETANGSIESYHGSVVGGLKQEQMATMDGAELQRYADRLQSGAMSSDDEATLRRLAYDTLHNEHLQGGIKGSQRTILENMAQGYTPPDTPPTEPPVAPPSPPTDLDIPHPDQPTPQPQGKDAFTDRQGNTYTGTRDDKGFKTDSGIYLS